MATPTLRERALAPPSAPASARRWFRASQRLLGRDYPIGWLFVLPTALLLFGLIGYPFVRALYLSVYNVVGVRQGAFVGLDNYLNVWADDFFVRAVGTTVTFTFWSEVFKFSLGLLAALKSIDHELYDAAAVDGANAWRRFLHVTLPGLRYVIIVATLLSTIFTFNTFTLTYLLTGGGPGGATRVYSILAYEYAVNALRYSSGVAVAMTVAPFLFCLILFLGRYMMRREDIAHVEEDDSPAWRFIM